MLGSSIGHYRVTNRIGGGGMGEVWRAHDTQLNRDVAVKVLPKEFADHPDRLKRFHQEAQALAALNHPNLLVVHDAGIHDSQPYLVSELLEGKTLRECLVDGPLPERKVIELALQLAHGLAAAHSKGIIHRDLKPENIFVTRDGRLKILDFGLAKLKARAADSGPWTSGDAATLIERTEPGVILGTAAYMSPEQVRGQPADARSDLFAFGAVLYELLSGKSPFRKATPAETMAAILDLEPPDLEQSGAHLSPGLDRVVQRCLAKEPEQRFQAAVDLAFALESLSHSSFTRVGLVPPVVSRASRFWRTMLMTGGAAAFLAAMLALWLRPARLMAPSYQQITSRRGVIGHTRFGADGHSAYYSAQWGNESLTIFRVAEEGIFTQVPVLTNADLLGISPSGDLAVLLKPKGHCWLLRCGTLARLKPGEAPRPLLEDVMEADWYPDGERLLVVRRFSDSFRLEEFPSGKVIHQSKGYLSYPRVSPQGDRVAFLAHPAPSDDRGWAVIMDRDGRTNAFWGEWIAEEGLVWRPSGNEIVFGAAPTDMQNWALFGLSTSGRQRQLTGTPGICVPSDMDRTGRLLINRIRLEWEIVHGTLPGGTERTINAIGDGPLTGLSRDGRQYLLSYQGYNAGPNYTIYLGNIDGSPALQVGSGVPLALSPNGRWMLAACFTPKHLAVLPVGAGQASTIDISGVQPMQADWITDQEILVGARAADGQISFYVKDLHGSPPRKLDISGMLLCPRGPTVSPQGDKFLAWDTNRLTVVCYLNGDPPRSVPGLTTEDRVIEWCDDNESVFIERQSGQWPVQVYRLHTKTGQVIENPVVTLRRTDLAGLQEDSRLFLTPDGKHYLLGALRILSDLFLAHEMK